MIPDAVAIILSALGAVYVTGILYFYRGLHRLHLRPDEQLRSVCVVVPARNEEHRIGPCIRSLIAQEYPKELLSIIIIDDQSSDRTSDVVRSLAPGSPFPITLLRSDVHSPISSPKLRAMSVGIRHSSSELIATTDADCTVHPRWVRSLNSCFDERTGVVTGMTVFDRPEDQNRFFFGIQHLDFLSYTAVAAAAIGNGSALVSLGSNMAFRTTAFHESGGLEPLAHINTGDDSLLSQRIAATGRWTMQFAGMPEAIVHTAPALTVKEAMHQRMRWVGQTAYYPPVMMVFMICTFVMYLLLLVLLPASVLSGELLPLAVFGAKTGADYLVMRKFSHLMGIRYILRYFIPTALLHIPLILLSTIGGYFFSFEWKERSLARENR